MGRMWEQPIFLLIIHKLPKLDSGSGYDTPASGRIELSGPPGIIRPLRLVNIWLRGVRIFTKMTVMASYLKCSVWSMDPLTMIGKKRVWHINDDNYIDLSEVVGLINGSVDNDWKKESLTYQWWQLYRPLWSSRSDQWSRWQWLEQLELPRPPATLHCWKWWLLWLFWWW